jgi:hypothetical protein
VVLPIFLVSVVPISIAGWGVITNRIGDAGSPKAPAFFLAGLFFTLRCHQQTTSGGQLR